MSARQDPTPGPKLTELFSAARRGDSGAVDELLPQIYDRLRLLARRQLRGQAPGHTLDTTALVHEAYIKLVDRTEIDWQDRNHFLCLAAVAMRHILVDHARRRAAQKRGGDACRVTFTERGLPADEASVGVLELDAALQTLAQRSERLHRLVELRFFGGLTVEQAAQTLEVSEKTAKRDWRKARAFLYREMSGGEA